MFNWTFALLCILAIMFSTRSGTPHFGDKAASPVLLELIIDEKTVPNNKNPTGQIKLVNRSTRPITIEYDNDPRERLDIIIWNDKKQVISKGRYGGLFFAVVDKKQSLVIEPNKEHEEYVHPFFIVPKELRMVGRYYIKATFRLMDATIESNTVMVVRTASDK
jgi:hypothetical protein